VVFNLLGSKGYRSDLPWVMKIRADDHLAAEIFVFVDDGRPTGHNQELMWKAAWAYRTGCSRRGIQDASRKRTFPTMTPGPWAGTMTHTEGGAVVGMLLQEKWNKTKVMIQELVEMIPGGPLPLQCLLEIQCFLMYVIRAYTWMNPYIKGMHLTVDSWHLGRAEDGFKWSAKEKRERHLHELPCQWANKNWEGQAAATVLLEEEAPETVTAVARYLWDLDCLQELTSPTEPPKQLYQATWQAAFFVIGDASGKAKGGTIVEQYRVNYKSELGAFSGE
jgi:hypothetical protein